MRVWFYGALAGVCVAWSVMAFAQTSVSSGNRVAVQIDGGYETNPADRGRPVVLIANALGVAPGVFREAFSHVRPAVDGEPDPRQAQANKLALLSALGRYGVTNERLDEVSDYYRYNGRRGESWKCRPAKVYATVSNGKVVGYVVEDGGAGYSSAPTLAVPGHPEARSKITVGFGKDLRTNGRIASVELTANR